MRCGGYLMKQLKRRLGDGRMRDRFSERRTATNWIRVCTRLGTLFVGLLFSGCSTFGPQLVQNSHIAYNKAIEQVIQEELLLNIVRRRYYEAPQFVTVSSISTSMSTSAGISGGCRPSATRAYPRRATLAAVSTGSIRRPSPSRPGRAPRSSEP